MAGFKPAPDQQSCFSSELSEAPGQDCGLKKQKKTARPDMASSTVLLRQMLPEIARTELNSICSRL